MYFYIINHQPSIIFDTLKEAETSAKANARIVFATRKYRVHFYRIDPENNPTPKVILQSIIEI